MLGWRYGWGSTASAGSVATSSAPRRAAGADIEWVAANDITDPQTIAHLLRYDSVLGRYPGTVEVDGQDLVVDGARMRILAERDPAACPGVISASRS